jgi:hypothetical protein
LLIQGGKISSGVLWTGFGRGRVLDQLQHPVAVDDFARRGGDVLTDVEGFLVGQRDQQVALVGLDVADQVLKPLDEGFAIGLDRLFQRLGVGAEEVGGAEHVDDLLGEILHPAAVFRASVSMSPTAVLIASAFIWYCCLR